DRKRIVRRWFVMSMLTGRRSGSFESTWEQDIRRIGTLGAAAYLKQIEESVLTDGFWAVALPAALETTSTASPFFQTFLAAQVATASAASSQRASPSPPCTNSLETSTILSRRTISGRTASLT